MVRYIALAVLLCTIATASMGCPRRVLVRTIVDTPVESVAK